jgi:hypothetical protein
MEFSTDIIHQNSFPILGRENQMEINLGERLRHGRVLYLTPSDSQPEIAPLASLKGAIYWFDPIPSHRFAKNFGLYFVARWATRPAAQRVAITQPRAEASEADALGSKTPQNARAL